MNQALLSSKNNNWCTPQLYFDELDLEFHFVLDAAANEKSAKCKDFLHQSKTDCCKAGNVVTVQFSVTHRMDGRLESGLRKLLKKAKSTVRKLYF